MEIGPILSKETLESTPSGLEGFASPSSASNDLSRVLFMLRGVGFEQLDFLWPGDETVANTGPLYAGQGFDSLYEYHGTTNAAPSLVGVDNNGHLISQCGTALGFPFGGNFYLFSAYDDYNDISAAGTRIFFTAAAATQGLSQNTCTEAGAGRGPQADELFVREELSSGARRTVAISEPTTGLGGDCALCATSGPTDAVFQGASEDGSKVFFLSEQHLLAGAGSTSLYEYNFNADVGNRVTLVAPQVLGVARVSEDGSHVYFVAQKVLTGANGEGRAPALGAPNLYVTSAACPLPSATCGNPTYSTKFIGTLSEGDGEVWQRADSRPFEATPDGRYAVFVSTADLTQGDKSSATQVFEYDSMKEALVRVSVGQDGFNENGNTSAFPATIAHPNYVGHQSPAPQPSSVSDDGAIVAFESSDALTPQAVMGSANIYEYHAGRVYLISDGQDRTVGAGGIPTTSLVGIDGSGADIFFTSVVQLVPQDGDTQQDLYDARAGGGVAPPEAPSACAGEGCQGGLEASPPFSSASSTGQPAGENVVEPPPETKATKEINKKAKKTKGSKRHRRNKAKVRRVRGSGRSSTARLRR